MNMEGGEGLKPSMEFPRQGTLFETSGRRTVASMNIQVVQAIPTSKEEIHKLSCCCSA